MNLPLQIKRAFGTIRTREEALLLWSQYEAQLQGYNFILALPGSSPLVLSARKTFGQTGFLASLFCHDDFFFLNDNIFRRTVVEGASPTFGVDADILFDTNAASYLISAFSGSKNRQIADFYEMVRHFKGNKLNWNTAYYLLENAEAFLKGQHLDDIFRVVLAHEKWGDMDHTLFHTTGALKARLADEAYFQKSTNYLGGWHRQLIDGGREELERNFNLVYSLLLQMVIIQLKRPSPSYAFRKMLDYLELLHSRWHVMFLRMAIVAWELFSRPGGSFRFFNGIQSDMPNLPAKLHGMAWDLHHFLFLEEVAVHRNARSSFLIPFFLTFDRGLSELWDTYPIHGLLFHDTPMHPIPYTNRDLVGEWKRKFPDKFAQLEMFFTFEAAAERDGLKRGFSDLGALVEELKNELNTLIVV